MIDDAIRNELRVAIDEARHQLAAERGEGTADRLARVIAESLSSEAKEEATYFAVRRWLLEGRAIG